MHFNILQLTGSVSLTFLWLLADISRAVSSRLRCSPGGIEAKGAMWCLGTGCGWGAAVGMSPLPAYAWENGFHFRQQRFMLGGLCLPSHVSTTENDPEG